MCSINIKVNPTFQWMLGWKIFVRNRTAAGWWDGGMAGGYLVGPLPRREEQQHHCGGSSTTADSSAHPSRNQADKPNACRITWAPHTNTHLRAPPAGTGLAPKSPAQTRRLHTGCRAGPAAERGGAAGLIRQAHNCKNSRNCSRCNRRSWHTKLHLEQRPPGQQVGLIRQQLYAAVLVAGRLLQLLWQRSQGEYIYTKPAS